MSHFDFDDLAVVGGGGGTEQNIDVKRWNLGTEIRVSWEQEVGRSMWISMTNEIITELVHVVYSSMSL